MRLANRRFISFYFDLANRGAAGDPLARKFVVAARKELGGRGVPTPPLLFMNTDGKVLGEVSNYASADAVLAAMQKVLKDHSDYNAPTEAEKNEKSPIRRAQVMIDLQRYDDARKLLEKHADTVAAQYVLGRLARWRKDWKAMDEHFEKVDDQKLADDLRMERAYRHWEVGDVKQLAEHLKGFPKPSNRFTEARYYEGLAAYHRGDKKAATEIWQSTITGCGQDPWVYRADWAYTASKDDQRTGGFRVFSTGGKRTSLLGRIGYMGRGNPDLEPRSK